MLPQFLHKQARELPVLTIHRMSDDKNVPNPVRLLPEMCILRNFHSFFSHATWFFFLMHFSWKHPVEVWLFTPSSGKWKLGRELLGSRPLKATIISNFCMIWNISSSPILCFDPLLLPKTNDEYLACLCSCCQTNTNKTERDKRAVVFTVIYEVLLSFLTKMKILTLQLWKFTWLCFIRLPVWFFLCYFSSPGRERWVCIESKRHRKEHPLCVTHRLMPPSTTLFQALKKSRWVTES